VCVKLSALSARRFRWARRHLRMSHGHDHPHHHPHRPTPERALLIAIVLNGVFLVVEALVGWWANSLALLSDAGHMVSDVGALALALFAVRIRDKAPSAQFTFGLRRAPVLGGLINAITLLAIVVGICFEAVSRLRDTPKAQGMPMLVAGGLGLFVNVVSAFYLARSGDRSVNIRGALLHLIADALGSLAALASAVAILFWNWQLADPVASLIIAALILYGSMPLMRETLGVLLQRAPRDLDVTDILSALLAQPHVRAVHDLHVWELDSGAPVLTALLETDADTLVVANALTDQTRAMLRERFDIDHATLECRHCDADDCVPDY